MVDAFQVGNVLKVFGIARYQREVMGQCPGSHYEVKGAMLYRQLLRSKVTTEQRSTNCHATGQGTNSQSL